MMVVAFSGGKDSTAMALRMAELGEPMQLLFTPTGNELPELWNHLRGIVDLCGAELVQPANRGLGFWIEHHSALPSWRMRWCTRQIKIEPCAAWLRSQPAKQTLCVGLRADEGLRHGMYGAHADYRYPLREWGWGLADVMSYLDSRCVTVPRRTDCAVCPYQRLGEWYDLWREHPEHYAQGEEWEAATGHTFRSPGRDTWPAALGELRAWFEAGQVPRGASLQQDLFGDNQQVCRVCSL